MLCAVLLGVVGAACGSSTTTSTAPSTIERCAVTLQAGAAAVPAEGGAGTVAVRTARECAWSAASETGWLSITGTASGRGDGSIAYRAAPNPDPVSRRGTIAANDRRTEIIQAAGECVIRLAESAAEFPPAGGQGQVEVEASSPLCTWTASTGASWIALAAPDGKGSAPLRFTVAATAGPPRTATITIAGQAFSVTQSQGCSYAIAPGSAAFTPSGGEGQVAVTTEAECPWTASSNVPWIAITRGAADRGPGTAAFRVAPTEGPSRTGTLVVAGRTFTVTQSPGCIYEVEPLAQTVSASGGTASVAVRTAPGCGWSAASNVAWITIAGPSSGAGEGTVLLSVAAHTGAARTVTVAIAGRSVTVSQGQGCTYEIAPTSATAPAAGGTGRVDVTAAAGCAWTATSAADWITITSGESGTGGGAVEYRVALSTGALRSATMTIAGQTFTVTQEPGCEATLSPASAIVPASGGSPRFDVRADARCQWTAAASVPWIAIRSGAAGSGNGTVRLDVEANTGAVRVGTVTAAGQTFTVTQESGCAVALSAPELTVAAEGGAAGVDVRAPAGCDWTAEAAQPWTTITGGATGTGDGRVAFTVAANTGPQRTGTIAIGGEVLTIRQAGECGFAIAPAQQAIGESGGRLDVTVTAVEGCAWNAASNVAWMSVTEGASGAGDGTVAIVVAANSGPARTGTATIAGQTFTVEQAGGCTYATAPQSRSADGRGGSGSFNVTTSDAACAWTAVSQASWITITGGGSGAGTGKVDYSVAPNSGQPRSGTIAVEDRVFTVNQSGR